MNLFFIFDKNITTNGTVKFCIILDNKKEDPSN